MQKKYLWIAELVWWAVSLLVAGVLISPYYSELIVDVPFLIPNVILIVLGIQCLRLTLFLRFSPFSLSRWSIFPLTFAFIPVCMYAIREYSTMSQFFNTSSSWMHSFSYLLTLSEKSELADYIRTEFTWCAVIAFIGGLALSGKMIVVSWQILSGQSGFTSLNRQQR